MAAKAAFASCRAIGACRKVSLALPIWPSENHLAVKVMEARVFPHFHLYSCSLSH
ncbi:MAG: hypothetical protein Rhims3KO_14990 [Hyphomicrobiales bacterium]